MVDSAPPDEGCELPGGEMNYEEWDINHNDNIADNNDIHILIQLGVITNAVVGKNFKKCNTIPLTIK